MLGVEPAVPINLRVIKAESALFISDFDVQVWVSSEQLIGKGSEDTFSTNVGGFVNYRADIGVLVQDHGGNDVSVWKILLAKIEVRLWNFSEPIHNQDKM